MTKKLQKIKYLIKSVRHLVDSHFLTVVVFSFVVLSCKPKHGNTLRVSDINPRYFTDNSGDAVYLTGSHTWDNLVDMSTACQTDTFDYITYIEFLKSHNHNFFRLWKWDLLIVDQENEKNLPIHYVDIHPWVRTGPGNALDGKLKFDLSCFNQQYFNRLRQRIKIAAKENIYVAVMLFEGWGLQFTPNAFRNHPFHPLNNINQIDLDTTQNANGFAIYGLVNNEITQLQEAYVRKIVETVGDLDNVLYEISNENHSSSTEWQYHMIRFIKELEKELGNPHPVGMTFQYPGGSNDDLFNSPADWISTNHEGGYRDDPPESTGQKVIISDTDHLWGIGGSRQWVWKSFLRGLNPIFMDPYNRELFQMENIQNWQEIRLAMGYTRKFAIKMDLINMTPDKHLSTSGYCLAYKGNEYLIYMPDEKRTEIDLSPESGTFNVQWFNPNNGISQSGSPIKGGGKVKLISPFNSEDAVVHIKLQ